MTPQSIIEGMKKKNQELSALNSMYGRLSERYAVAERDFNVALAQEILNLRAGGESATLAPTLAKGEKHVADLRMKMLIAEGVLNANRESIKNHRGALETYRSLLSWLKAEMELTKAVPT